MKERQAPPVGQSQSKPAAAGDVSERPFYLRLLTSFLTIVLPLAIAATAIAYLAHPAEQREQHHVVATLMAILSWPLAYYYGRQGRLRLASWLLIVSGVASVFVGAGVHPERIFYYLILPILFASVVLPARSVLAFAAATFAVVSAVAGPVYGLTVLQLLPILTFLLIGSILVLLGARYREQLEKERQRSLEARTEALQRANAFIGTLGRVAARVDSTTDLREVFRTLDRELHRLNINCLITLQEAASGDQVTRYYAAPAGGRTWSERRLELFLKRMRIPRDRWSQIEQLDPRRPAFVEDVPRLLQTLLPDLRPSLIRRGMRAAGITPETGFVYLPLIAEGNMIGAMILWAPSLQEEELPALSVFASQVAVAIDNARLVHDLETTVLERTTEIAAERDQRDAILRTVADAIITLDRDWRVQYVNPAFTRMTSYTADEILGRPIRELVGGWLTPRQITAIREAVSRSDDWKGEARIRRKDGRTYDAQMTIAAMHDGRGYLVGYVSTHQDVSHYKELDRARRRFIRNVSHELNTPVTSIRLYVDLLRQGPPEKRDHYIQILRSSVDRLHRLVADTLEMTRLDTGRAVTTWEPLALGGILQNAFVANEVQAEAAGVELRLEPPPLSLPVVYGDAARLAQAVGELIENGVLYGDEDTVVTVSVEAAARDGSQGVHIVVADTGPGILPAERARLFDRFHRGTAAQAGDIPGSGLGLSMVQEIVRAHGGEISVESQPGEGSAFIIWLPAAPESTGAESTPER